MKRFVPFVVAGLAIAFSANGFAQCQVGPPLPGAAFCTDAAGNLMPGGIFPNAASVYLNGGSQAHLPCPPAAPGLPDGDYYFQVLSGSSAVLLSTDAIAERRFQVTGGITTAYLGSTHLTSVGECGCVSIQLLPFSATPEGNDQYRVWTTRVEDYQPANPSSVFGFLQTCSWKDTFYITTPPPPPGDQICGHKFYDKNTDGVWQPGSNEPCIDGWKITLTPGVVTPPVDVAFTASCGEFCFTVPAGSGPYDVCEVFPAGNWVATTVTCFNGVLPGTNNLDFGNVCLGGGGGKTPGFWGNKNGKAQITAMGTASVLAGLSALNLVNANGSAFDPTSYSQFKSWLQASTATNMAYKLSSFVAAMHLNILSGFVDGTDLIHAPGASSANAAGFASVSAVLAEANAALGADGFTPTGDPNRDYQEDLKDALDDACNNLNFVQDAPCAFTTPY